MKKHFLILSLIIGFVFALLLSLSFASSSQIFGCCFNPSNGLCSDNTDMDNCAPFGGEFSEGKICNTVEKCQKGCCSLGSTASFVSKRECQLLSNEYKFDFPTNFAAITEKECTTLAQAAKQEYGACVYKLDYPPHKCKYTTKANCPTPDFFPKVLCTDEKLNTTCKSTDKTMCFAEDGSNEDVYNQDSCGNPSALRNNCDYSKGNTCGAYREGIDKKPSKGNLICRSLSCIDEKGETRKNGESWCTSDSNTEGGASSSSGSSSAASTSAVIFSNIKTPSVPNAPLGSRYFRSICLNGQVTPEPCEDFRFEYCDSGESGGEAKCKKNNYETCLNAKNDTKSCDTDSCYMFGGGIGDSIFKNAGLTLCAPKVPVGLNFYTTSASSSSSSSTSSSTATSTANTTCGKASQSIKIHFYEDTATVHCGGYADYFVLTWPSVVLDVVGQVLCAAGALDTHRYPLGAYYDTSEASSLQTNSGVNLANALVISAKAYLTGTKISDWNLDAEKPMIRYTTKNNGAFPGIDATSDTWMNKIDVNPNLIKYLTARCQAMGDCQAKTNWVGKQGLSADEVLNSSSSVYKYGVDKYYISCVTAQWGEAHKRKYVTCTLNFQCEAAKAPDNSNDCEKCRADGLECSEYRCKALGKKCDFYEKNGVGYCTRSTDNTAPVISCATGGCPKKPVAPYTPIEFAISTNEPSECKFNFNFAGGKYSEMKYDFGKEFSTTHRIIFSLPGQNKQVSSAGENVTEYPLLKEGKGTLYVRCIDAAGNGEVNAPFLIPFEVMKTPDGNSPIILSAEPASGSKIEFNTTAKAAVFRLNEPAECKWSIRDEEYSIMANEMICETSESEFATVFGYTCSAQFRNITTTIGSESKFYIRCKDQPYLEGNEDDIYKRNTNYKSYEYILKPSERLNIASFAPSGTISKGAENSTIEIIMSTSGGASGGKAECFWRDIINNSNAGFVRFLITNSNSHKQPITRPHNGLNSFEVKCADEAGNSVNKVFNFTLWIDEDYPSVTRLFESVKSVKVKTNENALCYYSNTDNIGCAFNITNATQMTGDKKEHTTEWKYDKTFYIKCKDEFGNSNNDCGIIIRTY